MAVTIKDVSAKCGLSISTVSKAFNNYADISLETRELVQRTAREIGYYPNAIARTLKTNRSYNLGVLFQEKRGTGLTHSFFASVLDAFKSAGEKRGYDITFINHHIGWTGMTYLEHCRYRNVDGVCVVCADFYAPEVIELVDSNLPSSPSTTASTIARACCRTTSADLSCWWMPLIRRDTAKSRMSTAKNPPSRRTASSASTARCRSMG